MTKTVWHIGDVGFTATNGEGPFAGRVDICGEERAVLLRKAYRGESIEPLKLLAQPFSGGWHVIGREDVAWETAGYDERR